MSIDEIIRAWKDPRYRESLSSKEQELLPENPAGFMELTEDEQNTLVAGTTMPVVCTTIPSLCVRNTLCGTCPVMTDGCC